MQAVSATFLAFPGRQSRGHRKGVGMSWPGFDGHLKRRHDEASAEVRHGTATTIHS
jgi:flavin-dependent dehydrogenase